MKVYMIERSDGKYFVNFYPSYRGVDAFGGSGKVFWKKTWADKALAKIGRDRLLKKGESCKIVEYNLEKVC